MLDEAQVDFHLRLVRIDCPRLIGNAGPETKRIFGDGVTLIREVQLKRKIDHDEVKLLK